MPLPIALIAAAIVASIFATKPDASNPNDVPIDVIPDASAAPMPPMIDVATFLKTVGRSSLLISVAIAPAMPVARFRTPCARLLNASPALPC